MIKIAKSGLKLITLYVCLFRIFIPLPAFAQDLEQIKKAGVLRHLAVPYANFVRFEDGKPSGMSVEITRLFAEHLNVGYEFVESDWNRIIQDLIGRDFVIRSPSDIEIVGEPVAAKGDLICTGFTVLPWRKRLVAYSQPIFPTQIWGIAKVGTVSDQEIVHSQSSDLKSFIRKHNLSVLGKENTCLDPALYGLGRQGIFFDGSVNDLALAVLEGSADIGLLDCPDTLIALRKWPEKIKVIGPVSETQSMAAGFRPESKKLLAEFDRFLVKIKKSGVYYRIVKKHYPDIFFYFPDAFDNNDTGSN